MADFSNINFICNKVVPLIYDDSLSYYEMLGKIIVKLNDIITNQGIHTETLQLYGTDITQLKKEMVLMKSELEKVKKGEYVSLYLNSIINYIDLNLEKIVTRIAKFVSFGLTNDGYFVTYIPDNWTFLEFDSDANLSSRTYGSLILRW